MSKINVKEGKRQHKINTENIKSFLVKNRELIFQCFLAVIVFFYGTYRLLEVGQPILFDDEFGYWSASSFFMGIDWSLLTGKIGYYSYGYGLLLVPIRLIGRLLIWNSSMLYEAAVVLNSCMLVGSFVAAVKLSKRYFIQMQWVIRAVACFAAVIYPSNIVFSHITWTENALTFFFWLFLYTLMKCLDSPSIKNHISFAFLAFYLYVVHQRAISIILTSIIIVIYMNLLKVNKWKHTAAFFGSMYVCCLIHFMIKGKLQNDFYLKNVPADFKTTIGYAFTSKTALLFGGILCILFILYLWDIGKTKIVLGIFAAAAVGLVLLAGYTLSRMDTAASELPGRIANNDFAGQWYKIKSIFTVRGFLRLCISIVGKWFYLAVGTGLVICWGMKELIKNIFWMLVYSVKVLWNAVTGKVMEEKYTEYIYDKKKLWLTGVCLAWISTFMVCAIYKEGLYKVDDLVNGRYNEYIIGVLIIYSIYALFSDKKWIRTLMISVILYLLAGILCQTVFDELGRTDFELCHSVMLGRVFWNWEVPVGKVKQISMYILPLGLGFILMVKLFADRFPKVVTVRCVAGLLIPIVAWSYLGSSVLENYVIARNEKQSVAMPNVSRWINLLGGDKNVYYLEDTQNYRWAEGIQFMLQEKQVILTTSGEVSFDEDAFYIMNSSYAQNEAVQEKCEIIVEVENLALAVPKGQTLLERFERYTGNFRN